MFRAAETESGKLLSESFLSRRTNTPKLDHVVPANFHEWKAFLLFTNAQKILALFKL